MSKRDWRLFLVDMLECVEKIERYLAGVSKEEFLSDEKLQDAVVRNLEIIGEAASQISTDIRDKYPEIPWKQIVSMRHRLIHGYFVVDYEIVWQIVKEELSDLKARLNKISAIEGF